MSVVSDYRTSFPVLRDRRLPLLRDRRRPPGWGDCPPGAGLSLIG